MCRLFILNLYHKINIVYYSCSFPDCYAEKFSPLQLGNETLEGGVPLEHLITCVPSITIVTAQNGFKVIKWIHNKPPAPNSGRNILNLCLFFEVVSFPLPIPIADI